MQDFTGVPALVDLAAMRDAMQELGGDAQTIDPLVPVDLVIDHSVQVDAGNARAFDINADRDYERNRERYESCAGASRRSTTFGSSRRPRDLPPGEPRYLGQVVFTASRKGRA